MCLANTFFTALAFVSWVADTGPHDARAMVIAGDVNALVRRDITFCSFPAAMAQTPPLHVLPISTAQHWAGCWGQIREITWKHNCTRLSPQKRVQESSVGFIFFIHSLQWGMFFFSLPKQILLRGWHPAVNCILLWLFKTIKQCSWVRIISLLCVSDTFFHYLNSKFYCILTLQCTGVFFQQHHWL